jgi:DNA-binding HxlR family transcriptional regulator
MAATGVETAFRMLEGRWKMVIIFQLFDREVLRFSELQRAIPGISEKMLIQQLRDLERDGIVARTVYPQVPPKVPADAMGAGHVPRSGRLARVGGAEA